MQPLKDSVQLVKSGSNEAEGAAAALTTAVAVSGSNENDDSGEEDDTSAAAINFLRLLSEYALLKVKQYPSLLASMPPQSSSSSSNFK